MKAIHKPTGKIVDVEYDVNSQSAIFCFYKDSQGNKYTIHDLDFIIAGDKWEELRVSIAREAAIKMINNSIPNKRMRIVAFNAVSLADALIEELKKQK